MPEFKEESDLSVQVESNSIQVEEESHEEVKGEESAHYALKRGRIPNQKKNISPSTQSNVGEVDIADVRNDQIWTDLNNSPKSNVQKTTSVVDKETTKKGEKFCNNKGTKSQNKANGKTNSTNKSCCASSGKCCMIKRFFKKIFSFFGFNKKAAKSEKQTRTYRYRNHNQRRRHTQNGNHQ